MDSLNSVVPLRIDKDGKINIEEKRTKNDASYAKRPDDDDSSNIWCGQEILSKLSSLKSVRVTSINHDIVITVVKKNYY